MELLVGGVHIDVALDLRDRHTFAVATLGDDVIEAENQIDGLAVDGALINILRLALVHDDLLHLSNDLNVLDDV